MTHDTALRGWRRVWSALFVGLVRVVTSRVLWLAKKPIPSAWKDRVKAWLLWRAYAGPRHRPEITLKTALALPHGVNLFGYLKEPTGLGQAARSAVRALMAVNIPVHCIPIGEADSQLAAAVPRRAVTTTYAINWCHENPSRAGDLPKTFGPAAFLGRFNIGYWAWELDTFPSTWDIAFRYYDEIWVPSNFVRQAVEERSPVPVRCIPHPVEPLHTDRDGRRALGIPADCKVFLCMFDMGSVAERKNPLAAVRAFKLACSNRNDVCLVVKVRRPAHDLSAWNQICAEMQGLNHLVIDRRLSGEEVWELLSACDALISLHRSEGFGLIPAEAMALGKPVIATGYSGNMDFMTPDNSFPVNYQLVRIERQVDRFPAGYHWAEPDIEHAAAHIRTVIDNPEKAKEVGARAARDIAERLPGRRRESNPSSPGGIGIRILTRVPRSGPEGCSSRGLRDEGCPKT